jgi:hypothetical protein
MQSSGLDRKIANDIDKLKKEEEIYTEEKRDFSLQENYMDLFKLYLYYLTLSLNGPRLPTFNTIRFAKKQLRIRNVPPGPHPFAHVDNSVVELFKELSTKLSLYLNFNFVEEEFREKHDISDEYCHRDLSTINSQIHLIEDIKKKEESNQFNDLDEEKKSFIKTIVAFLEKLKDKNHLEEILNSKNLKFFGEMIYC